MPFVTAAGHRLEYLDFGQHTGREPVVMLHEGLGSASMWKDFPERLAAATGRRVIAYSRYGYGRSDRLAAPRRPDYMHDEALQALPAFLDALGLEAPVLFGHSDGASIALIHAGSGIRPVRALVVLAPHVFVETLSLRSIAATPEAYRTTQMREKLARYHDDPDGVFWGWNRIWLDPAFANWNIEACLGNITCPALVIQGEQDEYGTLEQVDRVARRVAGTRRLVLADCGHSPHRDQPKTVLRETADFLA